MAWIPIAAWAFAVVLALVVLGFAAYEIKWKADRLARDVQRLSALRDTLTGIQDELSVVQERIARLPSPGAETTRPAARSPGR